MSLLVVAPGLVEAAAREVAGVGEALSAAWSAAGWSISSVAPAAGDDVSVTVAALFSDHARWFEVLAVLAVLRDRQPGFRWLPWVPGKLCRRNRRGGHHIHNDLSVPSSENDRPVGVHDNPVLAVPEHRA